MIGRRVQITYYDVDELTSSMLAGYWRCYLSDYEGRRGDFALALMEFGLVP